MKLLNVYIEHALAFERLAADENNPEVKTQFEQQATACRKLAAERAARYEFCPRPAGRQAIRPPQSPQSPQSADNPAA